MLKKEQSVHADGGRIPPVSDFGWNIIEKLLHNERIVMKNLHSVRYLCTVCIAMIFLMKIGGTGYGKREETGKY